MTLIQYYKYPVHKKQTDNGIECLNLTLRYRVFDNSNLKCTSFADVGVEINNQSMKSCVLIGSNF